MTYLTPIEIILLEKKYVEFGEYMTENIPLDAYSPHSHDVLDEMRVSWCLMNVLKTVIWNNKCDVKSWKKIWIFIIFLRIYLAYQMHVLLFLESE